MSSNVANDIKFLRAYTHTNTYTQSVQQQLYTIIETGTKQLINLIDFTSNQVNKERKIERNIFTI